MTGANDVGKLIMHERRPFTAKDEARRSTETPRPPESGGPASAVPTMAPMAGSRLPRAARRQMPALLRPGAGNRESTA